MSSPPAGKVPPNPWPGNSPMVDGSVLEGLAALLEPNGAFAEDLRAVGFDVRHPELRYTPADLLAVLDVCARHAYPERPREDAHRQIGQRFVERFFRTIPGRVASTLLRVLGMKRFLFQLTRIAALATAGLEVETREVAPGELCVIFRGDNMSPDFTTGTIEGAAQAGKFDFHAEIVRREPREFELRVTRAR